MIPELIPQEIFRIFLVFARVGGFMMVIPGFGEASVSPRIRLILSLLIAYLLAGAITAPMPALPENSWHLVAVIAPEAIIGLMMGSSIRAMMGALAIAGEITAMSTSFTFAQMANPMAGMGGSAIGVFMTTMGLITIFTTDMHHVFLHALADSYTLFPIGHFPALADASELSLTMVSSSFALGVQLSAPFILMSLVINLALALANRVMPQFQVFFISAPASILLGFTVLSSTIGIILNIWAARLDAVARSFGGG
jgi:flagellar biosynthetic protein FliR